MLTLAIIFKPVATIFIVLGGMLYFSMWLLFGGPSKYKLENGCWVKEVKNINGSTQIIITDGTKDIIQQFNSTKVVISGNEILVY